MVLASAIRSRSTISARPLVDRRFVQRRERRDADQRAFEFADVAFDAAGDEFEHIVVVDFILSFL